MSDRSAAFLLKALSAAVVLSFTLAKNDKRLLLLIKLKQSVLYEWPGWKSWP